jgi:hypothetical protein
MSSVALFIKLFVVVVVLMCMSWQAQAFAETLTNAVNAKAQDAKNFVAEKVQDVAQGAENARLSAVHKVEELSQSVAQTAEDAKVKATEIGQTVAQIPEDARLKAVENYQSIADTAERLRVQASELMERAKNSETVQNAQDLGLQASRTASKAAEELNNEYRRQTGQQTIFEQAKDKVRSAVHKIGL